MKVELRSGAPNTIGSTSQICPNTALKRMKRYELLFAWAMQKKGFKQTLEKYRDYDTSPATEKLKRFSKHFYSPGIDSMWVFADGKRAGAIELDIRNEFIRVTRFYILPEYRNRGIGGQALKIAEDAYSNIREWRLDTILEEKNNVHLYEKLGYREYGERRKMNERMTIINYKKEKER